MGYYVQNRTIVVKSSSVVVRFGRFQILCGPMQLLVILLLCAQANSASYPPQSFYVAAGSHFRLFVRVKM